MGLGSGAMGGKLQIMYQGSAWGMFHNEYLEALFNWGAIGLVLIVMLMAWTAWRCWSHRVQPVLWMGLMAVAITAAASIPFHIMPTAIVAAWYLGQTWRRDEAIYI
jgi:O-antigen ligase